MTIKTITLHIDADDTESIKGALATGLITHDQLVTDLGGEVHEGAWVQLPGWWCQDDSGGAEHYPDAVDADDAASEYSAAGDWDGAACFIHDVRCWKDGIDADGDEVEVCEEDVDTVVNAEQDEPDCIDDITAHEWGDEAVHGHGGGVISTDRCKHCGVLRHTDTWAQDSSTGRIIPVSVVTYSSNEDES